MKRVWAGGDKVTESVLPVGPSPVQPGGPPLLVGTIGPKTVRSAATWAGGMAGGRPSISTSRRRTSCSTSRGPPGVTLASRNPHLATSFLVRHGGEGDEPPRTDAPAPEALHELDSRRVRRRDGADDGMGGGNEDDLRDVLRAFEAIGTDEIHLIPTSTDVDQLRRVADVAKDFA